MLINPKKDTCYRITHIQNIAGLVQNGLAVSGHPNAIQSYVAIGNYLIIASRSQTHVKIAGYGMIGDYVLFYFTPRSVMLHNIVTGYNVSPFNRSDIVVMACSVHSLAQHASQWFFTDGHAMQQIITN